MPRGVKGSGKAAKAKPGISAEATAARKRIEEAERANRGLIVERIALTEPTLLMVADLVEAGEGSKIEVLRTALAVGVKALHHNKHRPAQQPYYPPSTRQPWTDGQTGSGTYQVPPVFEISPWGADSLEARADDKEADRAAVSTLIATMPRPKIEDTGIDPEESDDSYLA